jgi:hypothetical protein
MRILCCGNVFTEPLPRNGCCLQRHCLTTGIHATISLFVVHDSAPYVITNCVRDPFLFIVIPTFLSPWDWTQDCISGSTSLPFFLYLPGLCLVYSSRFPNNYKWNIIWFLTFSLICFAKPGLTEDLYIVQKEELSVTRYICDTYTRPNAKHIYERQTHLNIREDVTQGLWSCISKGLAPRWTDCR